MDIIYLLRLKYQGTQPVQNMNMSIRETNNGCRTIVSDIETYKPVSIEKSSNILSSIIFWRKNINHTQFMHSLPPIIINPLQISFWIITIEGDRSLAYFDLEKPMFNTGL